MDEFQNGSTGQKQVAETVSELNNIAIKNPELKQEAQNALNQVIEEDKRVMDDGKKTENQLMKNVKNALKNMYENALKKFQKQK